MFQKIQGLICCFGLIIVMGLPVTVSAVTVQIDRPLNGAVIKTDNTLVTGIASAVGSGGQGIDLMLVLDDSGSLSSTDPTRERFEATRQLLGTFSPNANIHIGLVFFETNATLAVPLQQVSNVSSAINDALLKHQNPGGSTAIGKGIQFARQELDAKGRGNTAKIILVFTDGGETENSQPESRAGEAFGQGYMVHVICLFSGNLKECVANQQIAQNGGGQLFQTNQATQLIPLFRAARLVEIDNVIVTNKTTNQPANYVNLSTGNFTAPVNLVLGQNLLEAVATDTDGAIATDAVTVIVESPLVCPENRRPICPTLDPSNCNCPPTVRVKKRPQVIMAGFDPMLVNYGGGETTFKVLAVVREGGLPIKHVIVKENTTGPFNGGMTMQLEGQLKNGDKVYSLTYDISGSDAFEFGKPLSNVFGSRQGEYRIVAIDETWGMHTFPDLTIGNNPDMFVYEITQARPYTTRGIRRYSPQVIMVGFDPILLNFGDDHFKIKAVVREGSAPIQHVVLKRGDGGFNYTLYPEGDIGNGDIMYSATYSFEPGALAAGSFRDLFGNHDPLNEHVVEVIDQVGDSHTFPGLEICASCPEYP